jgi:DNA polymerase III epsilon subunit-like protein
MSMIYAVIDTESEGFVGRERESACAWCVGELVELGTWNAERAHECIPKAEHCLEHYTKGTFSLYWSGLDRDSKEYKKRFTKFAVEYLARQRAAEGRPIFLTRTRDAWRLCRESSRPALVPHREEGAKAFDLANPAHVREVLRVFFSAEVVSCAIVLCEHDVYTGSMKVLSEECAEYRPAAEHKASAAAQEVHGLTAATLARGRDVSELHRRLEDILAQYPSVVFAAHCAQHDRAVLIESIDNRLVDKLTEANVDGDDAETTRLMSLRHELRDPRRWTCTWQRCVLKGSRIGAQRLANYRLPTVYEAVTQTVLEGHHSARTDAYACAVILCRILECDDRDVKRHFCGASSCTRTGSKTGEISSIYSNQKSS